MMKNYSTLLIALCFASASLAQVSGNINYQSQVRFPDNNINVTLPANSDIYFSVKGLANIKADSYVAIFSLTQHGKTTEEVNKIIDERIEQALSSIKTKPGVETFVDMISFVPVYEYEVEKKIFSKKTYNEIPAGFELKKNIHIKYSNPNLLNEIITTLSGAEIYDLVRVDYFANNLETVKKELMTKASVILQDKIKNYQTLLTVKLDSSQKQVVDGYKVVLPVEMYKSYQTFSSSSLNLKKSATVNQAEKSVTLYYQPIVDKEFDFVVNPAILEPVIQVMYEVKMKISKEQVVQNVIQKTNTEYFMITPTGDIKNLNIK